MQAASHGLSALEIGAHLSISKETVKSHSRHAREKMGVLGTTHAVANALRRGIIQ